MRIISLPILLMFTFLYGQEPCIANNIPYEIGGYLSYCDDGTTGCDCNNDCGGSAAEDDCGNCSGGNTGNIFNYAMDECGICIGGGPNIPCWDGSLICDADDCPFNPGDCPAGTVGMENYLGYNNICVPEAFSETIQTSQQGIYSILYVTIEGVLVEADDWVGAFNGSVCVGGRKWDTSQCGGICEVVVMGFDSFNSEETSGYMIAGDIPTFKIYDASENAYYDADASDNIPWSGQGMEQIDGLNAVNTSLSIYNQITPDTYSIHNIYPNPFNPITRIEYSLLENADIELIVYNIQGRHIKTLIQCFQTAGYHSINWNAQNYPSGIYFIRLESGTYSKTQKVLLFK